MPLLAAALLGQTATPNPANKKSPAKAKATTQVTAEDVKALREALAAQQQQIQQLREEMNRRDSATAQAQQQAQSLQQQLQQAQAAAVDAQQKAAAAESAANAQKDTVARLDTDLADVKTNLTSDAVGLQDTQRRTGALEALAGRFRFAGDVRIRGENFNQDGTQDRNRARVRVRFGMEGQLNQDFIAGFAIATGSLGDPTSTNETLTGAFDRKTIGLDRGFITFNPVAHPWFSATGGKWAYSWQRTSATFDPDLNPEGFNEKVSFDVHNGPVQNVSLQGLELLYNEVSGGQDSYALGIQAATRVQVGRLTTNASVLSLKWNRPDALLNESAFTVGATSTGFLPTSSSFGSGLPTTPAPVTGIPLGGEGQGCASGTQAFSKYPPCVFAPNGMTNATFLDSKGVAHFYSGFNYIDIILNNQIRTNLTRLPVNVLVELLDNVDAESHPLNTKGSVLNNLGSQNKEYGFDFSVGQLKNRNDFQAGYAWNREEQDAAIASFVESDQRAPTNILENRFYALWKLRSNTVAGFTWWHGRTLNSNLENNAASVNKTISKAGQTEPYLNRLQFDLIYTF
jgi:hypothetical protein